MSSTASSVAAMMRPDQRLEVLFDELAELAGPRNAIDARIVEIAAEMERDDLCGAKTIATVAGRLDEFPRCKRDMRAGRLSLDQLGVIAAGAAEGSDAHYAALARSASVNQLRTAIKLEPRPDPDPRPEPQPSITKTTDGQFTCGRIKLPHTDAAKFDATLQSHQDALIAEWKRDHDTGRPAPSSHMRGARLRRHSWSTRPSHPALGRRRPDRVAQPCPGVSSSPPPPSSRRHPNHRASRRTHRHRPGWASAFGSALPRVQRRTRRLVVVRAVRTATATDEQLGAG